ncbi:MAG: DUF4037 domain-containing protein [Firmicutes bacterium]|nr:DUF4037 domain-containing protein [Bacillota bacterium]
MTEVFALKSQDNFIPGLKLNKGFYFDVVKSLFEKTYPNINYAASLIGHCSDVLGFDDYKSTDHVWGPRLQIFLTKKDYKRYHKEIDEFFKYNLPRTYKGFPTNYKAVEGWFNNAYMQYKEEYPINHFIEIETVDRFFNRDIEIDLSKDIEFKSWLAYPIQNLLELTSGEVFYDSINELTNARKRLSFFPLEVLLIRIYIIWNSIYEEQAFIGRCRDQGDLIGESIIINRIVNKLMRLCFYYEERYYPYSKWFGVSFKKLKIYDKVKPLINKAIYEKTYKKREEGLNKLYEEIINKHNTLNITEYVEPNIINYYKRGYLGFDSQKIIN